MTNAFEKGFQPTGNELEEAATEASTKFLALVTPDMPGKSSDLLGDRVEYAKETGCIVDAPLTQTERLIVNAVSTSARRADIQGIQDALKAVLEHPSSLNHLMNEVKNRLETSMPGVSVGWETGITNNNAPFLRLNLSASGSKSGPFTDLTIGSDGRVSASHTPFMQWDRPAQHLNGEQALQMLIKNPFEGLPRHDQPLIVPGKPLPTLRDDALGGKK